MTLRKYEPTKSLLQRAFEKAIADSTANPWSRRSDRLSRVEAERLLQRGELLPQVQEMLEDPNTEWPINQLVHVEKSDGSLRPIEIPAIRTHIASEALRQHIAPVLEPRLPDCFYARRRRTEWDNVGVNAAIKATCLACRDQVALRLDIQNFFGALPHDVVRQSLQGHVQPDDIELIIGLATLPCVDVDTGERFGKGSTGLAQGNPLSPLIAQWVIRQLPAQLSALVREQIYYVDDFVLVGNGTVAAEQLLEAVATELGKLDLQLKHHAPKRVVFNTARDFRFLGVPIRELTDRVDMALQVRRREAQDGQPQIPGWPEGSDETLYQLVGEYQQATSQEDSSQDTFPYRTGHSLNKVKAYPDNWETVHNTHRTASGGEESIERGRFYSSEDQSDGEQSFFLSGLGSSGPQSLLSTEGIAPWVAQVQNYFQEAGRRPRTLLVLVDDAELAQPIGSVDAVNAYSTDDPTANDLPDNRYDVIAVVFSDRSAHHSTPRRRKMVGDAIRRTGQLLSSDGALLAAMPLSDFNGLWACQTTSLPNRRAVASWMCDTLQPSGIEVFTWLPRSRQHQSNFTQLNPDVVIDRLPSRPDLPVYEIQFAGRRWNTAKNKWMRGSVPRPRAALYHSVAEALRRLEPSEEHLLVQHHPDFQTQFLSRDWQPRKSYLVEPVRRLRQALERHRHVTFVPATRDGVRWTDAFVWRNEQTAETDRATAGQPEGDSA